MEASYKHWQGAKVQWVRMREQDGVEVACHIPEGAQQLLRASLIPPTVQQEHQVVHLHVHYVVPFSSRVLYSRCYTAHLAREVSVLA